MKCQNYIGAGTYSTCAYENGTGLHSTDSRSIEKDFFSHSLGADIFYKRDEINLDEAADNNETARLTSIFTWYHRQVTNRLILAQHRFSTTQQIFC